MKHSNLNIIIVFWRRKKEEEEEKKKKKGGRGGGGRKYIWSNNNDQNVLMFDKNYNAQMEETQWTPSRVNTKKTIPKHIINKLLINSDNFKIFNIN